MAESDVLRSRGNLTGRYVRPAGSDRYPPAVGTAVVWVAAQPVQDMLDQGRVLGWANKGTIGNTPHLKLHGDHTGHSLGKLRGIVYAKDTELPSGGKSALLELCRMPDYDTSYIDFFNIDNEQYSFAGVKRGPSGDKHLHVSVRRGAELVRVTLFNDVHAMLRGNFGRRVLPPMPAIFTRLQFIDGARLVKLRTGDPAVWLAGRGKRAKVGNMAELTAIQKYLAARQLPSGIATVDALEGIVVS